jgi:hypothetical protein
MKPCRWIARVLGRRGAVLLIIGLMWIMVGVGLVLDPSPLLPKNYYVWHEQWPMWFRVMAWVTTGTIACIMAWVRAPGRDNIGFVALTVMPTQRAFAFGFAWLLSLFTDVGYPAGWIGMIVWGAVTILIVIISGGVSSNHTPDAREVST